MFLEGDFEGQNYIFLKKTYNGQKDNSLTLNNPTICNNKNRFAQPPIPQSENPLCFYNLLWCQLDKVLSPNCANKCVL